MGGGETFNGMASGDLFDPLEDAVCRLRVSFVRVELEEEGCEKVPLVAGESYRVLTVLEFACPCGRADALLDVGIDFAWCQSRFRLMPKPRFESKTRHAPAPKVKEKVR